MWLFPNTRKATLIVSPVLVFYAVALVGLQYVCSINSGGIEYNTSLVITLPDNYLVQSIGLSGNAYPPVALILKVPSYCPSHVLVGRQNADRRNYVLLLYIHIHVRLFNFYNEMHIHTCSK